MIVEAASIMDTKRKSKSGSEIDDNNNENDDNKNATDDKIKKAQMAIRKFLLSLRLSPSMAAEYSRNLWEIGYDDMRAIVEDITLQDFTEAAVRRGHSIRILKGLIRLVSGVEVSMSEGGYDGDDDSIKGLFDSRSREVKSCYDGDLGYNSSSKTNNSNQKIHNTPDLTTDTSFMSVEKVTEMLSCWGFRFSPRDQSHPRPNSTSGVKTDLSSSHDDNEDTRKRGKCGKDIMSSSELTELLNGLRFCLKGAYNSYNFAHRSIFTFAEDDINTTTMPDDDSKKKVIATDVLSEGDIGKTALLTVLLKKLFIVIILFDTIISLRVDDVNAHTDFDDAMKSDILQDEGIDNNCALITRTALLPAKMLDDVENIPGKFMAKLRRAVLDFGKARLIFCQFLKHHRVSHTILAVNPFGGAAESEPCEKPLTLHNIVRQLASVDYDRGSDCFLEYTTSGGTVPTAKISPKTAALAPHVFIDAVPLRAISLLINDFPLHSPMYSILSSMLPMMRTMGRDMIVLGAIGQGSTAMVYKALYLPTLEIFAVKYMNYSHAASKKQLSNEFEALCVLGRKMAMDNSNVVCDSKDSLSHYPALLYSPYIVNFYDTYYDLTADNVCLVLEFMDGSLQDFLDLKLRASEQSVSVISYHLLNAFAILHANKVIHRDVKPGNVLVNTRGDIMLSDFGITKILGDGTDMADTFTGTFRYMAPERLRGESYSYESDIWSFGMTMLAMLIGSKMPFDNRSTNSYWRLNEAINSESVTELLCDIQKLLAESDNKNDFSNSPLLWDFLRKCLCKSPSDRSTAQQLLEHPFITSHNPPHLFSVTSDYASYSSNCDYIDIIHNEMSAAEVNKLSVNTAAVLRSEMERSIPLHPKIKVVMNSLHEFLSSIAARDKSACISPAVFKALLYFHICNPDKLGEEGRILRFAAISRHFEGSLIPTDFIDYAEKRISSIARSLADDKVDSRSYDNLASGSGGSTLSHRRAELEQMLAVLTATPRSAASLPPQPPLAVPDSNRPRLEIRVPAISAAEDKLETCRLHSALPTNSIYQSTMDMSQPLTTSDSREGRLSSSLNQLSAAEMMALVAAAPQSGLQSEPLPIPKQASLPERLRPPPIITAYPTLSCTGTVLGDFSISQPFLLPARQHNPDLMSSASCAMTDRRAGSDGSNSLNEGVNEGVAAIANVAGHSSGDGSQSGGKSTDFICTVSSPDEFGGLPAISCRPLMTVNSQEFNIGMPEKFAGAHQWRASEAIDAAAMTANDNDASDNGSLHQSARHIAQPEVSVFTCSYAALPSTFRALTNTPRQPSSIRSHSIPDSASPRAPSFIISLPDRILKKATPLHRIRSSTSLSTISDQNHSSPLDPSNCGDCSDGMSVLCRPRVTPRPAAALTRPNEDESMKVDDEAYYYSIDGSSDQFQMSDHEESPKKIVDDSPLLFF